MTKAMPIDGPVFRPQFKEEDQLRVIDLIGKEAMGNPKRRWGKPEHLHFHMAIDRLVELAKEKNVEDGFKELEIDICEEDDPNWMSKDEWSEQHSYDNLKEGVSEQIPQ